MKGRLFSEIQNGNESYIRADGSTASTWINCLCYGFDCEWWLGVGHLLNNKTIKEEGHRFS